MQYAHEIMDNDPLTVAPETTVKDLARALVQRGADGACVMDGDSLVGVVTSMDLIFQERSVHLPTYVTFLDAVLPIGQHKALKELEKVTGGTVSEIMTKTPISIAFDAPLDEVARLMVDRHITVLPVVRDGRLVGAVTKPRVLESILERNAKGG